MFYGLEDAVCVTTADNSELVILDNYIVGYDELVSELITRFYNCYAAWDMISLEDWCNEDPRRVADAITDLDFRHNCDLFGLGFSTLINVDSVAYITFGNLIAVYDEVYDELEALYEEDSGHCVDDDGGFEFVRWCLDNKDIVIGVLSRKQLIVS